MQRQCHSNALQLVLMQLWATQALTEPLVHFSYTLLLR